MLRATYLELQFSRKSITELVRTSLVMSYPPFNPLLPPGGEELPTTDDGTRFVTLSTAFLTTPGATTLRHGHPYVFNFAWGDLSEHNEPVPARRCEVTQHVRVDLARREKRGDGQLQDVEVGIIEGTLVVDLMAFAADNLVLFDIQVKSFTVDTPNVDPRAVKALEHHGLARFLAVEVSLPWGPLLGQPVASGSQPPPDYNPNLSAPHVQNCAAALTDDLSTFALRIQLGGEAASARVSEWIEFHAGNFPNRLRRPDGSTAQWGTLLSPPLVEALSRAQTEASLAQQANDFRLTGGVGAQWAPDGTVPYVRGSFDGTVLIPCRPRYHVTFDGRIEVTAPNSLVTTGHVDWDGNNWDLALCEAEAALTGGIIGAAFGSSVGGPLGGAIGFTVGVGVGFIGGIVAATVYTPDLASDNCDQDGNTLTCTRTLNPSLSLGPGLGLPVQLTSAEATEDGLVMTGTYALPLIPALTQTQLVIETKPFNYTDLPVNCGNLSFAFLVATAEDVASFTHAEAVITLRYIDDDGRLLTPLPVTVTLVSPDHENVFPPSAFHVIPYSDRTEIHVTPLVTQTTPINYWAAPYGCTVRVNAVVATRTIEIPAPARLSAETLARLHERAQRALSDCLAKQQGPDPKGGRRELGWLVDPGPGDLQSAHFWQVGVLGAIAEETLHLEDQRGQLVARAPAGTGGTTRLTVITGSGAENRQLVLRRAGGRAVPARRLDVRLKQTELVPHGVLQPGGRVQTVHTREANGRLIAAVRSDSAVTVYDVTFPNAVQGFFRADAAGVRGVTLLERGVALWGAEGLTLWPFDEGPPRRVIDVPVHDARLARDGLVALTDEHVLAVAGGGRRVARLAAPRSAGTQTLGTAAGADAPLRRSDGPRVVTAAPPGAMPQLVHVAPFGVHSSRSPDSYAPHSFGAESSAAGPSPSDVPSSFAVEYFGVGSTLLVATADGAGLLVFAAGRSIEA